MCNEFVVKQNRYIHWYAVALLWHKYRFTKKRVAT